MIDWHRLKWFGVLVISLGFTLAGGFIIVVSGEAMGWVAFTAFLFGTAMAVHELWPSLIEGRAVSPAVVLARFPGPVTLRMPWRKQIFILVTTVMFGGCLLWMALYSDMDAVGLFFMWLGAIGCFAAVPVFLLLIARGATLRLDATGMQVSQGSKRSTHRWSDTSAFSVVNIGIFMVVFDDATLMNGTLAQANISLIGRSGGLPDTYGMGAPALAWLLNEWRARAIAFSSEGGTASREENASMQRL